MLTLSVLWELLSDLLFVPFRGDLRLVSIQQKFYRILRRKLYYIQLKTWTHWRDTNIDDVEAHS